MGLVGKAIQENARTNLILNNVCFFSLSLTLLLAYYGLASFPPPSRSPALDELMSQPPNLRLPFYPTQFVLQN